jgi:hypothetical protein
MEELIKHLVLAIKAAEENIEKADNFDLVELIENLELHIDNLKAIGKFETFED